jgi:hypothetical protein
MLPSLWKCGIIWYVLCFHSVKASTQSAEPNPSKRKKINTKAQNVIEILSSEIRLNKTVEVSITSCLRRIHCTNNNLKLAGRYENIKKECDFSVAPTRTRMNWPELHQDRFGVVFKL